MSVHYKFKSNLDHDTVTFDGLNISVADLKKSIIQQKRIGKSADFDLQITNAQTKEVYDNDEMLILKILQLLWPEFQFKEEEKPDIPLPIDDDDFGHIRYDRIARNADLVNVNASEDDKDRSPFLHTCYRCRKPGHWIKFCPTNNPDVKRSTGIPRSFMVPVDGPDHKGALLTSSGDYAVPLIDHQAYKEVKKEKPPFVRQEEPATEPEAEMPEELLCMFCKDLLQDAVLIPCCGNSFCDECVRQVLLESDDHQCPVCHETDVSPDTLIPNRFLRTAVLNYKNVSGYARVKRAVPVSPPTDFRQPSPDSTVESQSLGTDTAVDKSPKSMEIKKDQEPATKNDEENPSAPVCHTPENMTPKGHTEEDSDAQPGTPLADEPSNDGMNQNLPIQAIGQEQYNHDKYEYQSSSKFSRHHRDDFRYHPENDSHEPRAISTIETITNTRKGKFGRSAPMRHQFPDHRSHRDDSRSEGYYHDRDDYRSRYDKRHASDRSSRRTGHASHYDKPSRDSRYANSTPDYPPLEHENEYDLPVPGEEAVHRHRYRSPPQPVLIPPVPAAIFPPPIPTIPPPHPGLLPTPQIFHPQPPPPASQPPPPGVGPLLPSDSAIAFSSHPFENEDPLKDASRTHERSIDDKIQEFQRKLEKRHRYSERGVPEAAVLTGIVSGFAHHHARSYSSKSWTRSPFRNSPRSSRSRSRTPFSSRSRTRSYSHSRSRSWSKKRSYTRSRSRNRSLSRSRSRSRNESSLRRRGHDSRNRRRSPVSRSRSRSYSPKGYRLSSHQNLSYAGKHGYGSSQYVDTYQSQYGHPPVVPSLPLMRPPEFPVQMHSMPPPVQPMPSKMMEPYPVERQPKYPYGDQYSTFNAYQSKYSHRFERERISEHRTMRYNDDKRYEKRPEYQRHQEEIPHHIPGYIGDRSREYKPRYRQSRDVQRKEIKELLQITESDTKLDHIKESSMEKILKKDEKAAKHKKHHHHHKSKDIKKQESKVSSIGEGKSESSSSFINIQLSAEKDKGKNVSLESDSKSVQNSEKLKDKKHRHKKHKTSDHVIKKKKSVKKEVIDGIPNTDSDLPPKTKKKKIKPKVAIENQVTADTSNEKESSPVSNLHPEADAAMEDIPKDLPVEDSKKKSAEDTDVLDIFADDPEAIDFNVELIPESSAAELENSTSNNGEYAETENTEISGNSEEEEEEEIVVEEPIQDENILRVDVPGISKWEREESEEEDLALLQQKSSVVNSKDEKSPISSDIISRAENALLSKQLKPRIDKKERSSSSKNSSDDSSSENSSKQTGVVELKSVINSEQLKSESLQVTISSSKDKRSVYSRKDDVKHTREENPSRRDRYDRPNRSYEESTRRTISIHSRRDNDRSREHKDRISDRKERRYSPQREGGYSGRNSSRERKDYIRRERDNKDDDLLREERRRRFDDTHSRTGSHDRSDRRKPFLVTSRSKRPLEKEIVHHSERNRKREITKRSRSKSIESGENYSSKRKYDKKHIESSEEQHSQRSNRERQQSKQEESAHKKYSPVKVLDSTKSVRKGYYDEMEFEPNYEKFSDEEKSHESKEVLKRKAVSPENSRKTSKVDDDKKIQKTEKLNMTSSSSAGSESDSSDSDEQKGSKNKNLDADHKQKHKKSKHKKHKKHKHKHKKKKSHKSKKD
ncbi:e3 ubiquitin-protein ligase RBBP6 [Caerostris extrusa]|uniref:E3 ubiquitin-protein ligase RBBP6 n=1 Tax=Caerostris extrusa TaxID=172846 RepID=A0AAV4MUL6_CAEEX|nr:e3 ubiquitin-protein ligase RBBP6 [Caerostris extrusa]